MPPACHVPAQMASALKHIHDLGLAHLDLKPDNIYCAQPQLPTMSSSGPSSQLGSQGQSQSQSQSPRFVLGEQSTTRYVLGDFGALFPTFMSCPLSKAA